MSQLPEEHDRFIRVHNAREHNLRGVNVELPRDALVAFTGVSGSGKSSLAFGTLYAEAQRRYFESVAPYARRLLNQVGAPHVDAITGLPPAVALEQRRSQASARSTVGTVSAMSNSLRMLFSRAGDYPEAAAQRLDSDAFSPNTAVGACPRCHGLGDVHEVTEASLVHDPSLSIRDGAITAWPGAWQGKNQRDILAVLGYDIDAPWHQLKQADRDWILFTDEQPVVTVQPVREAFRTHREYQGMYMSARRYIMRTLAESQSATQRARALRFVETRTCPSCNGARLRSDALAVTIRGCSIAELGSRSLRDVAAHLAPLCDEGGDAVRDAAAMLSTDIVARITTLEKLGLAYLSLDRPTPTLSPGELQRLRIATQLRSGLFGVVYVLDEPSAGLHPADAEPLLDLLGDLRAAGNTICMVEHDMNIVRTADWVIDVGPGAGEQGGCVLYAGPVDGLVDVEASQTRSYLFPVQQRDAQSLSRLRDRTGNLELRSVTCHNVRSLDVDIPTGVLTAVTGVSGSGKTSLVMHALAEHAAHDAQVDRVIVVDQAPIGRTPRSNLATYTGLFDGVRKLFAQTDLARERGYRPGRFSFNMAGGRCETCQGEGFVAIELLFMPGTYAPCPTCHGLRYEPETLDVTWRGHSIADVLGLTVDDARALFADVRGVARSLETLAQVGLGYLRLGQPATELSGGEAQRIKLASELQRRRRGHALYLLDEPTTGLHPADVALLMQQLDGLVDAGNSVVVIEHDMTVVARADWVIDMGPGAGSEGGHVVAQGRPQQVAESSDSVTAPYLGERLAAANASARAR